VDEIGAAQKTGARGAGTAKEEVSNGSEG